MPFDVYDYPQALVFKGMVYIGGGNSLPATHERTVMVYDPQLDSFDTLPPYNYRYFSMAVVNNQLVLVGGADVKTLKMTNKLGVWNEESKTWAHPLPPMTIACCSPSVVVYKKKWLVIMGGCDDETTLSRVEILDTTEFGKQYLAAPVPQPCYSVSTVTFGNMCYLVGGYSTEGPSRKVFSVFLDDLISQAVPQPAGTRSCAQSTPSPWTTMPDTPLVLSNALILNGALLTLAGSGYSTTIYYYQPSTMSWVEAGELPTGRLCCACTVLSSGELFVAGSRYRSRSDTNVDIASIK